MKALRMRSARMMIAVCAIGALASAAPAAAQSKTGTTIGAFLLIEPSARSAGMGNTGVTLEGLEAAYFNPAAIGYAEGRALAFGHSEWFAGIQHDHIAGALPMGRFGNLYAAVTSLNSGDIDVRTVTQPQGTGERYHVADIAIGIGYGRQITDRFSAGVQVTYVQETIWNTTLSTGTMSIGTLYQISDNGLRLGASLLNFGTMGKFAGRDLRVTYDGDPDRFGDNGQLPAEIFTDAFAVPVLFRVGVGLPVRLNQVTQLNLALDALHPNDNTESVSAGAELAYRKRFALRAGYQKAGEQDSEVGFTAGGGVGGAYDVYVYRLDYAWAAHGRLGSTHRVAVGLTF